MKTLLLKTRAVAASFFKGNVPAPIEPPFSGSQRQAAAKLLQTPITGNQVLELCPFLTPEGLASLIETHLAPERPVNSSLHPYVFWRQSFNPQSGQIETHGCPPLSREPHAVYMNCSKQYDFSRILFEFAEVKPFMEQMGARFEPSPLSVAVTIEDIPELKAAINAHIENQEEVIANQQETLADLKVVEKEHQKALSEQRELALAQEIVLGSIKDREKELEEILAQINSRAFPAADAQTKLLLPVAKEVFKGIFESKQKKIKSEEFIFRFKKFSPDTPVYIILGFWALLARSYKHGGRPEFQDSADYADEKA